MRNCLAISATKRHKTSFWYEEKLQKIMNVAASLRHPSKTTLPYRGGGGGGGGVEREVRLDDRMAAFTQRVVSPAETRFQRSAQQSHRSLSPPINIRACEDSASFRLFGFVLLCFILMRRVWVPCRALCVWIVSFRVGEQSASSLSREPHPPPQQIQGFSSVSTQDNHLVSSLVFPVVRLPCA